MEIKWKSNSPFTLMHAAWRQGAYGVFAGVWKDQRDDTLVMEVQVHRNGYVLGAAKSQLPADTPMKKITGMARKLTREAFTWMRTSEEVAA